MSELEEIIDEMGNGRFADRFRLNPPIELQDILDAEEKLSFPLPEFYRRFLLLANGCECDSFTLYGIYPSYKPANQLLHPRTYAEYQQQIACRNGLSHWFEIPKSMKELLNESDLVFMSRPETLEAFDIGYEQLDYDKILWVGGVHFDGNPFCLQQNDETLYAWVHDENRLTEDRYGSLIELIRNELKRCEQDDAECQRPKSMWEKIGRWWNREG